MRREGRLTQAFHSERKAAITGIRSRDKFAPAYPGVTLLRITGTDYILGRNFSEDAQLAMNAPSEMSFEEMLRVKLEVLRREHRDLDEAIAALDDNGRPDVLTVRRLKKQKLSLKDQIASLEDRLIPDIIA